MTSFFYGPDDQSEQYKISPAPKININTEYSYSNDVLIGYTYKIAINGFAMLKNDQDSYRGFPRVLSAINNIQTILSKNGGDLNIFDGTGKRIIKAKGGTLRSLSFDNGDNNWVALAPFSAEIEFNELEILNENFDCNNIYIDSKSHSSNLVDISKYKIKEFTDSWNLSLDDESYNFFDKSDSGGSLGVNNSVFQLTYSVSAVGKNYYQYPDLNGQLLPPWVHAKNFSQNRLANRVKSVVNSLKYSGSTCSPSESLSSLHSEGNGIYQQIRANHNIFNETVSCSASESDGSFSLEYSCILKSNNISDFSSSNTLHTINKTVNKTLEGKRNNININIEGNIQGLCPGGLFQGDGNFSIPDSGSLISPKSTGIRITSAQSLLNNLLNTDKKDLNDSLKTSLNITKEELEIEDNACNPIKPSSFSLTTNFMDGSITYSFAYDSTRCKSEDGLTNVRINIEEPVSVLSELIVPNGDYVVQDIGTTTARRVTLTASVLNRRVCCGQSDSDSDSDNDNGAKIIEQLIYFQGTDMETIFAGVIKFPDKEIYTITSKEYTYNFNEGSYNLTLAYICNLWCDIKES